MRIKAKGACALLSILTVISFSVSNAQLTNVELNDIQVLAGTETPNGGEARLAYKESKQESPVNLTNKPILKKHKRDIFIEVKTALKNEEKHLKLIPLSGMEFIPDTSSRLNSFKETMEDYRNATHKELRDLYFFRDLHAGYNENAKLKNQSYPIFDNNGQENMLKTIKDLVANVKITPKVIKDCSLCKDSDLMPFPKQKIRLQMYCRAYAANRISDYSRAMSSVTGWVRISHQPIYIDSPKQGTTVSNIKVGEVFAEAIRQEYCYGYDFPDRFQVTMKCVVAPYSNKDLNLTLTHVNISSDSYMRFPDDSREQRHYAHRAITSKLLNFRSIKDDESVVSAGEYSPKLELVTNKYGSNNDISLGGNRYIPLPSFSSTTYYRYNLFNSYNNMSFYNEAEVLDAFRDVILSEYDSSFKKSKRKNSNQFKGKHNQ